MEETSKKSGIGGLVIGVLGVLGVGALFALMFMGTAFSYRGDCVRAEAGIEAQYKQNQNNYDNMWKKFREMAQVPDMYVADVKKVYDGAIQGRYGADGAKQLILAVQEQNPNLDPSLYTKLQSAIEAGRNGFAADQQQLLAKKQAYDIVLKGNTGMFVNWLWNFPHIDLAKFDIVTSDATQKAFEEKKTDELQLRK
ncbi:hypothetical protein HY633_00205 [Candidatus Uhrbacteria bacterium]|nr:hypothetical protein [Candidatus Uhrbacteria bacterium]